MKYSDREFKSIEDYPSENTLTVNVTHEQLKSLEQDFKNQIAISPSRKEEGDTGYDVSLETAREIVFQHKNPKITVCRNGKRWVNFKIDPDQCLMLGTLYNQQEAYYALPVVPERAEICQGLDRTIFVDIWEIFCKFGSEDPSRIYISYHHKPKSQDIEVVGKISGGDFRDMNNDCYFDITLDNGSLASATHWGSLRQKLGKNEQGIPIRGKNSSSYPFSQATSPDGGESPDDHWDAYTSAYQGFLWRRNLIKDVVDAIRGQKISLYQLSEYVDATPVELIERFSDDPEYEQEEIQLTDLTNTELNQLTDERLLQVAEPPEEFDALLNNIVRRSQIAIEDEWAIKETDFGSLRPRFWRFAINMSKSKYPLTYRIRRLQRLIMEKGNKDHPLPIP
ncbi:hypothetical protein [Haladaptatus caseinilyticus]|uniref:hypothetical protein n=1 Tax=Haladaptatus caseinilyticus TaxID=2993314 RepID=UPI00224B8C92|nr:hypothetical protein [Haladaptatus caseinilyticus]